VRVPSLGEAATGRSTRLLVEHHDKSLAEALGGATSTCLGWQPVGKSGAVTSVSLTSCNSERDTRFELATFSLGS
jgi:hypothetical protein